MTLAQPRHPLEIGAMPLPERLWHLQPFVPDVLCRSRLGVKRVTALGNLRVSAWPQQPHQDRALDAWPESSRWLALELLTSAAERGADVSLQCAGGCWTATVCLAGRGEPHTAESAAAWNEHPVLTAVTGALLLALVAQESRTDTHAPG